MHEAGAADYYVKTHEEDRIVTGVLRAIRMVELQRENQELSRRFLGDELGHPEAFQHICGISKGMRAVLQYVESIAQSSQPVLITGESGVGKELIARAIHAVKGCPGAAGIGQCCRTGRQSFFRHAFRACEGSI